MSTAPDPSKNALHIKQGDQEKTLFLDKDEFRVGREGDAHARIRVDAGQVYVRDLGSPNGIFVAGRRLQTDEEVLLATPDEEFRVGTTYRISVTPGVKSPGPTVKATGPPERGPRPIQENQFEDSRIRLRLGTGTLSSSRPAEPAAATPRESGTLTGTNRAPGTLTGTTRAPGTLTGTTRAPGTLTGTTRAPGTLTGTTRAPGTLTGTTRPPSAVTGTRRPAGPVSAAFDDREQSEASIPETPLHSRNFSPERVSPPSPASRVERDAIARELAAAESARAEADVARTEADSVRADADAMRAEAEAASAEANAARAQAEAASAEANATRAASEAARAEAETALAQAEAALAEVEAALIEAETVRAEVEVACAEAEAARARAEAGRAEAETARAGAEAAQVEAENAQEEAMGFAERLREEAQKEALEAREVARTEAEVFLENARKEAQAVLDEAQARAEQARLENEAFAKNFAEERDKVELELNERKRQVRALVREKSECKAKVLGWKRRIEAVQGEFNQLEAQKTELDAKKGEVEAVLAKLKPMQEEQEQETFLARERLTKLRVELAGHEEALCKAVVDLKAQREESQRVSDVMEFETRKHKANIETLEAEYRTKRTTQDAALAELERRRDEVSQNLRETSERHTNVSREIDEMKAEAGRRLSTMDEKVRSIEAEILRLQRLEEDAQAEHERVVGLVQEQNEVLARLATEAGRKRDDIASVNAELVNAQRALVEFNERTELEKQQRLADLEIEMKKKGVVLEASLVELAMKVTQANREYHNLDAMCTELENTGERIRAEAQQEAADALKRVQELEEQARVTRERTSAEARVAREAFEEEARLSREQVEKNRAETLALETKARTTQELIAKLENETEVAGARSEAAREELKTSQTNLVEYKKRIEDETSLIRQKRDEELALTQTKLAEYKKHIEDETVQIRQKRDEELAVTKEKLELEARNIRARTQAELAAARQAAQTQLEAEVRSRKQAVEAEFTAKGNALTQELADIRQMEMDRVALIQEEADAAAKARSRFVLEEIIRSALELSRQGSIEQSVAQFRGAVQNALDGKSVGTLNVQAAEQTRAFWKRVGIGVAVPALLASLVGVIGLPGMMKQRLQRTIASEKKESGGVFMEEIRQRGLKYQPPMDRVYRETYSDNVLYLEDYAEMKRSEEVQKEWTLLLNDFIVGRLGLSDRIIPDFISTESVMIKELSRIREGILPQFKDQGIARMVETEHRESEKLLKLLQNQENYQKFRGLERSFYQDFIKRKSSPH